MARPRFSLNGDKELRAKLQQLARESRPKAMAALQVGALDIRNRAAENAPAKTGTLRRSITEQPAPGDELAYDIGTDLEYAPYVELGTMHMPPRAFLRGALDEAGPTAVESFAEAMRRFIDEVAD